MAVFVFNAQHPVVYNQDSGVLRDDRTLYRKGNDIRDT